MSLQRVVIEVLAGASLLVGTSGIADAAVKANSGKEQAAQQQHQKRTGERSVTGKVASIDSRELTLSNGEQIRLTDKTRYLSGKQTTSRNDIKAGEEVRAEYVPRRKLAYATQVQLEKSVNPSSAGTGSTSQK